ncbi:putative WRKY transcription factor 65 isoform X2 [Tasmannia lanceolata]|uniref:putative WRKY transcription factor 65 isoform X2 n=1 Tax=Tasmannia lanceolata TaxID=3420 RepID=UPI0040634CE8
MDGRFNIPFLRDQEEPGTTPENGAGSPLSGVITDGKTITTASSPKRRRAVQKRVVSVPIADVEGSRLKGEGAPPSDSWAWRKYGQKPIKGSPYPRGYYRCSSSKGCPARKQVERSRVDPTMLVVTYACEHNHPWPTSRNTTTSPGPKFPPEESPVFSNPAESTEPDDKFTDLGEDILIADEFCWFSDVATSPSKEAVLQSPSFAGSNDSDDVAAMIFPMREEDESLFADLGELPECSVVFRRGFYEERRKCSLRAESWCGGTG